MVPTGPGVSVCLARWDPRIPRHGVILAVAIVQWLPLTPLPPASRLRLGKLAFNFPGLHGTT